MVTFERKFTDILVTETKKLEEPPISDAQAFKQTLEPGTNPHTFDVPPNPEMNYKVKQTTEQLKKLQTWITEIETFVDKLNGLDSNSIQSQLNSAECETVFSPIARSETKKISRIAQDLSGLAESLKGHLMSADTNV